MEHQFIAARVAQLDRQARQLVALRKSNWLILAALKRLPASHWRFYNTLELMAEGRRSRVMTRREFFQVIDCPLFTLNQKIDILENTSAYEPPELETIRAVLRDTTEILKDIVRRARHPTR